MRRFYALGAWLAAMSTLGAAKVCSGGERRRIGPQSFVECVGNMWLAQRCPVGTSLDSDRFICERRVTSRSSTASKDFKCPLPNGRFGDPISCQTYYSCEHRVAKLHYCPMGQVFNVHLKSCDDGRRTECKVTLTHSPAGSTTTLKITTTKAPFKCPNSSGYYPDPVSCEHFFHCSHGKPYRRTCPPKTHFSPEKNVCFWIEAVNCRPSTPDSETAHEITKQTTTVTDDAMTSPGPTERGAGAEPTSSSGGFRCPNPFGWFRDPSSCEHFYQCTGGRGIRTLCPEGMHFNKRVNVCDQIVDAHCEDTV
ncbi:protein obstructor-E-like [Galendromus occidentalis]|uniref:Protein obstructor-E-like n=1 Tax=Galendromus occidentalis TaxID=34638 RepID=A0AAJ7SE75_9ACAR|nr:protein obstructor-E-like [Galendromus occidentalis]